MASASNDLENDIISHEEVETWNLEALKDFCRCRGYKVTGSKKDLVSRVYFLYNNCVPEKPGAKEEESTRKRDYQSIFRHRISAPDPYKLKNTWVGEEKGLTKWPPVSYVDIDWFLRKANNAGLSKEALTAYKTGKAFSYFSCDWLKEVFYNPITKNHQCCFLKADCMPSNRLNDTPHTLWAKIIKDTGEIVSAYCSCVAG